ncbi:putative reverse transcriptase domain-containing protein [Tanacetum coccineum]
MSSSSDSATDLEDCSDESFESSIPRETSLRDDVVVRGSDKPYSEPDIDPKIQAEIDECIAYDDALRAEGIDVRVVVKTAAREEVKTSTRGMVDVRVDRVTHHVVSNEGSGAQDCSYGLAECHSVREDQTLPNTRSRATMTHEVVNELIGRRVAEALEARDAARNLDPLVEGGEEQGGKNGDDYEGGNEGRDENGNGYENHNVNVGGFKLVARECTYQDFLKCQPLNFKGMEGVVGLTRWFEKIETVFHISNCPQKNQTELMKLLTGVYCLGNKIQKMEADLWNLDVRGNDLTAYIRRFQELVLLCTRMVPDEEDKDERFIGGLPDNIQGNVIDAEPTRLQEAIRIANNLMDQKLKGYA